LFIVDLEDPLLAVPPWLREQSQQEYFFQIIFISNQPLTESIQNLIGQRIYQIVSEKTAFESLSEIISSARESGNNHSYKSNALPEGDSIPSNGLLGHHSAITSINKYIEIISKAPSAPCLIRGETGTGKNTCARMIHRANSLRDDLFFVKNCENSTSLELLKDFFGVDNETENMQKQIGLFEQYSGGTLVLKNIEKLPREVQDKLLLVLDDRVYRPFNSKRIAEANLRIIGTTKHNLEWFVKNQNFNSGLYFHLNAFEIHLPPLRERLDDFELLASYYLQSYSQMYGKKIKSFSTSAMKLLKEYKWPGNIREVKDLIEMAVFACSADQITNNTLPESLTIKIESSQEEEYFGNCSMREIERIHIEHVLEKTKGNKSKAASVLDISRTTLREKMRQYGLN
jgi:DNA-binding NtrC family response regulator